MPIIIKDLYPGTNGHVTVGKFMSDKFKISNKVTDIAHSSIFIWMSYVQIC